MDRFLLECFTFEMSDEILKNSLLLFTKNAQVRIEKEENPKVTFNYYPQEKRGLQLIIEGNRKDKKSISVSNIKVHHTSPNVWTLKIIDSLNEFDNCYMVSKENDEGFSIIRLVNEQVLEHIQKGDIINVQVIAFAVLIDIFESEEQYEESVPVSSDGEKYFQEDGSIIPTNFILNNNANLTEKERKQKDHDYDNLVDIKGTIKKVWKYPLRMYDVDLNNYYGAEIETEYGLLDIIIPGPMIPKGIKGFGEKNIICGKVLLSGDACIDDYYKYIKNNKTIVK